MQEKDAECMGRNHLDKVRERKLLSLLLELIISKSLTLCLQSLMLRLLY